MSSKEVMRQPNQSPEHKSDPITPQMRQPNKSTASDHLPHQTKQPNKSPGSDHLTHQRKLPNKSPDNQSDHLSHQVLRLPTRSPENKSDHLTFQTSSLTLLRNVVERAKSEMVQMRREVVRLEVQANHRRLLEQDIASLRLNCDQMAGQVTQLTGGRVPLGDTDLDFSQVLPNQTSSQPTKEQSEEKGRWSCSECTFANHPSLTSCEICEMPRMGPQVGDCKDKTGSCFCHPGEHRRQKVNIL